PATAASEYSTASPIVCAKLRPTAKLHATGMINNAETNKAPTIFMAAEMTNAVSTVSSTLRKLVGNPVTCAASSSKDTKNSSLRNNKTMSSTPAVMPVITNKSV